MTESLALLTGKAFSGKITITSLIKPIILFEGESYVCVIWSAVDFNVTKCVTICESV